MAQLFHIQEEPIDGFVTLHRYVRLSSLPGVGMIDWDRVTELQDEIGEEDFIEVGRMFIEEMQEKLQEMGAAAERGTEDYHYLRGSAANLGLSEFADLCGIAEVAAKSGESTDFAAIRASFDRSVAEISDLFQG